MLRPTGCIQLVSLWWADRRLSGGRVFLGAGQRDHVQTACPATGDGRLHRHPSGDGESTLSGHLQARWESDSLNTRHNDLHQNFYYLSVAVSWVSFLYEPSRLSCRTLQPVSALRPHGSEQDASAGLESAAQLLLLSGADVQRRLILQAAHQERRIQESRWRRDACLRRGRGLQLDHGESCRCVWPEAVSRVFQPQAWWKNKEMFVIFEINFVKKTFFFHYSVVLLYSSFNYFWGAILQRRLLRSLNQIFKIRFRFFFYVLLFVI